jgi:hypothetical protein
MAKTRKGFLKDVRLDQRVWSNEGYNPLFWVILIVGARLRAEADLVRQS